MEFALSGIGGIMCLIAFVCSVLVIVKMFQNEQTGIGIASIIGMLCAGLGHILTLIFGWKNKVAWDLGKLCLVTSHGSAAGR